MTGTEAYLALLRAALWGSDIPAGEELSPVLDEILELADRQKTRGLIYDQLLRSDCPVPGQTAAGMQQLLYRILTTHQRLDDALVRVVSTLQQADIPCVLLKGQGVARLYPSPMLRECGDIDLYIGAERLEQAVLALTPIADKVDDQLRKKHWEIWIGESEIELHQHMMVPETQRLIHFYQPLETDGLSRNLVPLDFGSISVDTPADTFNAFYLFYHAWHHFVGSGIGFRQLCDWTLLMHMRRDHIDRSQLHAMLEGMRLLGPWQVFGCIAVHDLGLPETDFPFYDGTKLSKSRRILDTILSEGNFGHGIRHRRPRPKGYLASKTYSFGLHVCRFFQILRLAPGEALRCFRIVIIRGIHRVYKDLFHR